MWCGLCRFTLDISPRLKVKARCGMLPNTIAMKSVVEDSFLQRLTNSVSPVLVELDTLKKPSKGFHPKRPLTTAEQYLISTFKAFAELEELANQLDLAAIFLTSYRNTATLKNYSITRYDYLNYHIEGHLLRVTGIMDRLLIAVNVVVEMGLSTYKCKPIIMLFSKGKKTKLADQLNVVPGLYTALCKLSTFIDSFRDDRNTIAHAERVSYENLKLVEMLSIVTREPHPLIENYDVMKEYLKLEGDKRSQEFKKSMLETNEHIRSLLAPLYILLEGHFNSSFMAKQLVL